MRIGLIVNPIAGVGAALAWKGTDDVSRAWKAVEAGHDQPIWPIMKRALASIPSNISITWILGGDYPLNIDGEIVYNLPARSTAKDTINATKKIAYHKPDLILFGGGDGTAADIAKINHEIPMVGVPSGVKIFSPCFLHRPQDLGSFLNNWQGEKMKIDLLDLDEEAYSEGRAEAKLVTSAVIPVSSTIQSGKISWTAPDSETYRLIAERIREENWLIGTIAIGPGSTMKEIFKELGYDLSLLGIDLISEGEVLAKDCTQEQLESFSIDQIWLSPIGNQGHIFGRGNRQFTPRIIKKVGKNNLKIFSTLEKIRNTSELYVDTGDSVLDEKLTNYIPVIVGYHEEILKKIV